jgi:hypothetical protein
VSFHREATYSFLQLPFSCPSVIYVESTRAVGSIQFTLVIVEGKFNMRRIMSLLRRIADNENPDSLASKLRLRRFAFFRGLLDQITHPLRILDVGGTDIHWERMGLDETKKFYITILNTEPQSTRFKNVETVVGDARHMPQFSDGFFDVVYSNSVIEHVGSFADQQAMAREIQRLGKRYFVQTPSKWFPMEPHFLFPCFQFLPVSMRVWIASHYKIGWYCRPGDPVAARKEVEAIRLLTCGEGRKLFPTAKLYKEKFFGLTKSYVFYGGW